MQHFSLGHFGLGHFLGCFGLQKEGLVDFDVTEVNWRNVRTSIKITNRNFMFFVFVFVFIFMSFLCFKLVKTKKVSSFVSLKHMNFLKFIDNDLFLSAPLEIVFVEKFLLFLLASE